MLDIDAAGLQSAVDDAKSQAQSSGTRISAAVADITSEAQVAVEDAWSKAGGIDIMFANAAIGPAGRFMEVDADHFRELMDVNFMGTVLTLKAILPRMTEVSAGHIVVINSIGGYMGVLGAPACCAAMGAKRNLVESLRLELIESGVSIHLSNPTFTDTPMLRESQENQVAESILKGLEAGQYLLPTPDFAADMFLKSCLVPCSPRPFSLLLDMLMAPGYVLLHWIIGRKTEAAARRHCFYHRPDSSSGASDQVHKRKAD
ncbi:hypothetical protein WJX73_004566 [Symbiochloris irregularis]|uniref:Uncharacterized protein n=1 Tax=Symbiochloris irregularis TaxID=706552 RepID=A0AAW1PKH9_9CHLO